MLWRDHNGNVDWHDTRNAVAVERMRALWMQGLSTLKIGAAIGVSKNAVVGVARRANFPARPSPIRASSEPKPPRPEKGAQATLPPLPSAAAQKTIAKAERQNAAARKRALAAQGSRNVGGDYDDDNAARFAVTRAIWASRREAAPAPTARGNCCWPIGEPRTPGFCYCDAPAKRGSYCAEHAAIAYEGRSAA